MRLQRLRIPGRHPIALGEEQTASKEHIECKPAPNISAILFNLLLHSHELSDGRPGGGWIRVQREVVSLDHTNLN
jgi:hypothetical protein